MHLAAPIAASGAACLTIALLSILAARIRRKARTDREIEELLGQEQYEYTILDVRRRADFIRVRLPGSKNIPYDAFDGGLPTENMFEKIFVYGPNRRVARRISRVLGSTGYFNITSCGSFRGWKGPVEEGPPADPRTESGESSPPAGSADPAAAAAAIIADDVPSGGRTADVPADTAGAT